MLAKQKRNLKKAERMSAKTVEAEPSNAIYLDTYAWIFFMKEETIKKILNFREMNRQNDTNIKTLIIIDEAHLFIDPKYPVALDVFYQMNKRIRKYHCRK